MLLIIAIIFTFSMIGTLGNYMTSTSQTCKKVDFDCEGHSHDE